TLTTGERFTTADGNGAYAFSGLTSGSYNVRVVTTPNNGYILTSATNPYIVSATLGQTYAGNNFAFFPITYNGSANNDTYALSKIPRGTAQVLQTLGGKHHATT